MAEIASVPAFMTGELTLSGNGYTAHVSSAALNPTARNAVHTDLAGVDHPIGGKSSYVLAIEGIQDSTTVNSLSKLARANDGVLVAGTLSDGVEIASFSVLMAAGAFGGTTMTPKVLSLSLPTTYPTFDDVE